VFAAIFVAACGSAPSRGPAASTRAAIDRAEHAELARDHAGARAAYEQAIAAAPDPASEIFARREYASSLEAWGEVSGAIAQLEAVVQLDRDHAPSWHDLGILHHAQGDDPRAIRALREAERIAPDDPRPRIALAALLWQTGDLRGAQAEYRALLGLELPPRIRDKVEWALRELAKTP
jgi:Flp pilus assembly protein TadD